jgi:hypothetical protein
MTLESGSGGPNPSMAFRICRALLRVWFALSFRKLRVLHAAALSDSGPALLAVSHPASFLDALILVAALKRPVRCLLERKFVRGHVSQVLARALDMIILEPELSGWRPTLEVCDAVLAVQGAVLTFADQRAAGPGEPASLAMTPAAIAVEMEARHAGQLQLRLFPVHLFLPVERAQSRELLIYVDSPVVPEEIRTQAGGELPYQVRVLAAMIEGNWRENAFRLQPHDLAQFLDDLEEVLRVELEEDWAERPNWKQSSEGFSLSQFVADWAEQLNSLNPGRLVTMRESLEAWREARRRHSLRQIEVELASSWLNSPLRRVAIWLETLVGFFVALYGLINHLLMLLILYLARSFHREEPRERSLEWTIRAGVAMGCYILQTWLVAHFWGRAAAGYYLPTLPVSGAYLWRYAWLIPKRTRLAYLAARLPGEAARVRRRRREFVAGMNESLDLHADFLSVPH